MSGYFSSPFDRRKSVAVAIGNVMVGGDHPVVVQSMTNTDTADVDATVAQVAALHEAGSELVRVTVDRDESAAAVPKIRERLDRLGLDVPLIGDFHYIGHKLLADHPACAEALAKYRINPGNVGFREKRDRQFTDIVEMAIRHSKPVRIGVNWGSLDQELLTRLMDDNHNAGSPMTAKQVTREAIVQSALLSAELAEETGLPRDRIILSAKVSQVQDLIAVYTMLAERSNHALHLGLTEAGMGSKGIVASSAAMAILLQQGIGDTIRISLTPEPGGDRTGKCRWRRSCCKRWDSDNFCRLLLPVRAAVALHRPCSRNWRKKSSPISAPTCRSGGKNIPVWRPFRSPSWGASSTARANPNMPISEYRFPEPGKCRRRLCSSMARRSKRYADRTLPTNSGTWLPNTSKPASGRARNQRDSDLICKRRLMHYINFIVPFSLRSERIC